MTLRRAFPALASTVAPLVLGAAAIAACSSGKEVPPAYNGGGASGPTLSSGSSVDGCAGFGDCSAPQSVTTSPVAPPPLSGGTLLMSSDGFTAIVSDPDRDRILVVDLQVGAVTVEFQTPQGAEPGRAIEDPSGAVHVVLRRAHAILSFAPHGSSPSIVTDVCADPRGIAHLDATNEIIVACAGGELVRLSDGEAPVVKQRSLLGPDLRDVVVSGDKLFVSHFRSAAVDVLASNGALVKSTSPSNYVGTGGMPDANSTRTYSPTVAWRMIPALGGVLMMHQQAQTSDVVVDPNMGGGYANFDCNQDILHSEATLFDQQGNVVNAANTGGLASMPLPVDLAMSHDGTRLAVIAASVSIVAEMDPSAMLNQDGCSMNFPGFLFGGGGGGLPDGGFGGPDARMDQSSPEPVAVAYDGNDDLVVQLREPAALEIHGSLSGSVVSRIELGGESRYDTGYLMFHSDADGIQRVISCASCHPEGREDGHTWQFDGFGARRTQSLAAGVIGTEPFHWDGSLVDLGAVMSEVFVKRMGGIPQGPARVNALKGYLSTFPDAPAVPAPEAAAAARGEQLFRDSDLGCSACHTGALLTSNETVDVGTGAKFQVPSLRGVAARAPFMHNGCAETLTDRFNPSCGGGDLHGKTSNLSASQLADLVAYLETL